MGEFKGWLCATAGAAALLTGGSVMAQTTPSQTTSSQSDAVAAQAETVVVTAHNVVGTHAAGATKTDTPIQETPQAISIVTQGAIELHNYQDLSQILYYSAGVTPVSFGYDPHFPQFDVRGFNEFYNGVYQDGLRLYGANQVAPLIEPYGLTQLEIVRGPSSVLYGQNAPGGLLDAITKRPDPSRPFGELQLQVGSYDRYDGRWDVNTPMDGDGSLAARFVGVERESGSQFANVPDDETYLAPSLLWRPREGTSVTLLGDYERTSTNSPYEEFETRLLPKGYPQTVYQGSGDQPFERQIQENESLGYLFSQALGGRWILNQDFRYVHSHVTYAYPVVSGFDSPRTIARTAVLENQTLEVYTLDTNVVGHVATGPLAHTLLFGVDYQDLPQTLHEFAGKAPDLNYFSPVYLPISQPTRLALATHQSTEQAGVYGQDQIKLGAHWALTGSVRYDWSFIDTRNLLGANAKTMPASQDDTAVTGRVGLVYLSDIGLAPYVSYSTSFLPQAGVSAAGQSFDPLKGEQEEVGVRYQPKSGLISATLSLYNLTESNVLGPNPNLALSQQGFQVETGEERSRGAEFELTAHPMPELNLTAAYTYDDVRVTRSATPSQVGDQVQDVPANQGSIFADYTFSQTVLRGFGLGAGVRYAGRSRDSNTSDGFSNQPQLYVDALAHYDFGRWRAQININNVANNVVPVCFSGTCNFSRARQAIGSLALRF